jgi:hypothetical protein
MKQAYRKCLLVCLYAIVVILFMRNLLFIISIQEQLWRLADFNHYYASSLLLTRGLDPYAIPFASLKDTAFLWHPKIPTGTNTPALILFLVPLTKLTPELAWIAWTGLLAVALFVSVFICFWELHSQIRTSAKSIAVLIFFTSEPVLNSLMYAQVQPLILLLLLGTAALLAREKDRFAGLLLGASIAAKLFSWPFLLFLLITGRIRSLIAASASFAAIIIGAELSLPRTSFHLSFFKNAIPRIFHWGATSAENRSIAWDIYHAFGKWLVGPDAGIAFTTVACGITAAYFAATVERRLQRNGRAPAVFSASALLIATSFSCSAVAWPSYLIAFFPLALVVYCASSARWTGSIMFLVWLMFFTFPNVATLPYGLETGGPSLPNPFAFSLSPNAYTNPVSKMIVDFVPALVLIILTFALYKVSGTRQRPDCVLSE